MKNLHLQHNFFLLLLAGILILTFFIFLPYLNALIIAGVFAVLFRPLYRLIRRGVGSEGFAALVTILIVLALIITPLFFFGKQIIRETNDLYVSLREGSRGSSLDMLSQTLEHTINRLIPAEAGRIDIDFRQYADQALSWFIGHVGDVFTRIAQFLMLIFVSLIALYYFLKDGTRIKRALIDISPLADAYDDEIFARLHLAVNSVIRGSLTIAVIQGALSGIGFSIFGVPNPALWGGVAMIAALIPGIGTSLVLIPAILYLFATGDTGNGVGLLAWGAVAVGMIDNFLGPRLIGRRVQIHELLILLSVLGGLALFGPIGFIMGPLVLSLLVALLDIYKTLILKENNV